MMLRAIALGSQYFPQARKQAGNKKSTGDKDLQPRWMSCVVAPVFVRQTPRTKEL